MSDTVELEDFEQWINEAVENLPPQFRERVENVAFIVEEWPDPETLRLARVRHPWNLLGFYHGIPLPARTMDYGLVPPDTISIYRQPILRMVRTREQARAQVMHTVRHELAHYFGIDDDRLLQIGAY